MKFDLSKDISHAVAGPNMAYFCDDGSSERNLYEIYGPKGSGKTTVVQEYVRSCASAFYISFSGLSYDEAVKCFVESYIPTRSDIKSMDEAVTVFMRKRSGKYTVVIFEDESSEAMAECSNRFFINKSKKKNLILGYIHQERYFREHCIYIGYRSVAEYLKVFSNYEKYDAMRLHALTGGMMAVAKELDPSMSYEENVRTLLRFDSAFSTRLPAMLSECFRTPDCYYPFFSAMAAGHCRVSEIAKYVGFPNNKCLNYLEALIKNDFVVAEKLMGTKQSTYHLANSYYAAWGRYVYGQKLTQISNPDKLIQYVAEDIDEHLTLPAFYAACKRFILRANKEYNFERDVIKEEKNVPIKIGDGSMVIIDYCVNGSDVDYNYIFPHSLDMRYTKKEIGRINEALATVNRRYNAHTVIFSFTRFSDWCVHHAARSDWFHIVPIERLKY
ncbi:MAG: ATP-binding protein [Clostridia bacterium]|nr:ATP-binding protein [Clostridia bacterium]